MERVRSGLHRVVEVTAAGLAVFRIIIAGLDGDFLQRVNAGLTALIELPPHAVCRILPLNADSLRTRWHPVNAKRVVTDKRGARQERYRRQRISNVADGTAGAQRQDWKITQRVQVDVMAYFTTFRFQQRRSRFDRDLIAHGSDFQFYVYAHRLREPYGEVRPNEFLESWESGRKFIGTDWQLGKREISRLRTAGLVHIASTCILGFNSYTRHH